MNRIFAYYAHEMDSGDWDRTADYIGRLGVTHSGSFCTSWIVMDCLSQRGFEKTTGSGLSRAMAGIQSGPSSAEGAGLSS